MNTQNSKEIWKQIEGFPYYVSSLGRIKNKSGKILKQSSHTKGYKTISLYHFGPRTFLVHRLVAEAFIPNPDGLPTVNHKNLCKADNWVENLEWCSHKENINHAHRNGAYSEAHINREYEFGERDFKGEKNPNATLTKLDVLKIRLLYKHKALTHSCLAKAYGVKEAAISKITTGRRWADVGGLLKY